MRIVKPYAKMGRIADDGIITEFKRDDGFNLLRMCEYAGRVSHRTEDKQDTETFMRKVVMSHGDLSVIEHASVSVEFLVDRGITHEIVRHRIAAYTQESTRFVNYEKKMPPSFIYPIPDVECPWCLKGYSHFNSEDEPYRHLIDFTGRLCEYANDWIESIYVAENSYKNLIVKGWRPQEARSVFPNALASKIIVTYNLRMWRHFFLMRTSKEAHPQMRQVTIPLLKEFQEKIPILYEDIVPEQRQADNMRMMR